MNDTPQLWELARHAGVLAASRAQHHQAAAMEAGAGAYMRSRQGTSGAAHRQPTRSAQQLSLESSARVAAYEAMRSSVMSTWPSRQPGYERPSSAPSNSSSSQADEQLADIERERLANMERNAEQLRSLGLL